MPYRKLPKTDKTRLEALQKIVDAEYIYDENSLPFSNDLLHKAKTQLMLFNNSRDIYQDAVNLWQNDNAKYRLIIKNLRMYISHFIRVYNMSIERGEFKKEGRVHYGLSVDCEDIPDLSTDEQLLQWGKTIIQGERERMKTGGTPMTNPTVANLQVHYDEFTDLNFNQKIKKNYIVYTRNKFDTERQKADTIIKEVWDEIECGFADMPKEQRIEKSKELGIVFYDYHYEKLKQELTADSTDETNYDNKNSAANNEQNAEIEETKQETKPDAPTQRLLFDDF